MSWELKSAVKNFREYSYHYWKDGVRLGYLIYFSEKGVYMLDTDTLKISFHDSNLGDNFNYYIFNDQIYFSSGKSIFHLNKEINEVSKICDTEEDYITMLNNSFCMGRTVTPRPRSYKSALIRIQEKEVVYTWEDRSIPIYTSLSNYVILENRSESFIKAFDIQQSKELWSLQLSGSSIPRYYQYIAEDLFLVMQCYDIDHPVDKRYELWGVRISTGEVTYKLDVGSFRRLMLNNDHQKLFGVSRHEYISVDPKTGTVLETKNIDKLSQGEGETWADIGNQSVTGDDIYFVVFGKPIIGRFNIVAGRVEEFIEIQVDDTKVDMVQPLGVPLYHDGKLYVRDNSGVMHILQRESDYPA